MGGFERGIGHARAAAAGAAALGPQLSRAPRQWFAIGDPQAPLSTFMGVLAHHGLLAADGWLRPDVGLVSVGDHFDYGPASHRHAAAEDGEAILAWLAAHAPLHAIILAGNHDLARVGELSRFDDQEFDEVFDQARAAYREGDVDREAEDALCRRYPQLPSAELAARDFASFTARQRTLVARLLRTGRLRMACAFGPRVLVTHAGICKANLESLAALAPGLDSGLVAGLDAARSPLDARALARALDEALRVAVAGWGEGPLEIPGLHRVGSRAHGEGGGILYHRPAHPETHEGDAADLTDPLGRRFDPRELPAGIIQVVGHTQDPKLRTLLGPWVHGEAARLGQIRHLEHLGQTPAYATGLPAWALGPARPTDAAGAAMIFTDGSMLRTPPAAFELVDLRALARSSAGDAPPRSDHALEPT